MCLLSSYVEIPASRKMIHELDRVVLTERVPAERLECGDVGTVVHVYADGKASRSNS